MRIAWRVHDREEVGLSRERIVGEMPWRAAWRRRTSGLEYVVMGEGEVMI